MKWDGNEIGEIVGKLRKRVDGWRVGVRMGGIEVKVGGMLGKCRSLKLVKKFDEVKKKRKKTVTFLKRRHC